MLAEEERCSKQSRGAPDTQHYTPDGVFAVVDINDFGEPTKRLSRFQPEALLSALFLRKASQEILLDRG
jgi:hypothetical protein